MVESMVQIIEKTEQLRNIIADLRGREASALIPAEVIATLAAWGTNLNDTALRGIAGLPFLKMWLRRSTLEPLVAGELGEEYLRQQWQHTGRTRTRIFPLGIVGHWPAGNITIQPLLSMVCCLLGGNKALVRVPSGSRATVALLLDKLATAEGGARLLEKIALVAFPHDQKKLHEVMAAHVDGAMIWGGQEAVTFVRSLPFPPWARLAMFGPRISAAVMDRKAWQDESRCRDWCRRLARDVWQFDQKACSSPQTLFIEKGTPAEMERFLAILKEAFIEEAKNFPRTETEPIQTSAIIQARAAWLLDSPDHKAFFFTSPEWTILFGQGSRMPEATQGRVLTVLAVDDLRAAVGQMDGNMQTLGLALDNPGLEANLADLAGLRGVDRIVKLGQMHTFQSPWDGQELIRPMVRIVQHLPSALPCERGSP